MIKSFRSKAFRPISALLFPLLLASCVTTIPVEDYAIARAAYDAAKEADAARYAPAMWFNAEQAFREAQKTFKDRQYKEAQKKFRYAKNLAEQAENMARLARYNSGEVVP